MQLPSTPHAIQHSHKQMWLKFALSGAATGSHMNYEHIWLACGRVNVVGVDVFSNSVRFPVLAPFWTTGHQTLWSPE